MKIIAYIYSNPLLESTPNKEIWGWEIDQVYQDFGEYQQLEQLLVDCQTEKPDYLLIRRLEELGDNVRVIGDRLKQLEALGIVIITTEQDYSSTIGDKIDDIDLKNYLSKLFDEIQVNKQRLRLQLGHARNRLKILPPPGKAPYGYRRGQDKYIIDKSTAPVVKDFFERFLLFGSLRGAVRYLEKRYGKKISPATGRNWLINPVYRGDLKYKNQQLISNTHTPIINREEAAQIDRLLRRNSRLPARTASAPRSLAGLVICQQCQLIFNITRVTQRQQANEYLYLRCHNCPQKPKCKAIAYAEVLTQTINQICVELPLAVAELNLSNDAVIAEKIQQEIKQKQDILEQLPTLLQQEILDQKTFAWRNYNLRTEIAQLETKIAQLPPDNLPAIAKAVSIPQFWLDLSEAERRFYFREFITEIEIIRNTSSSWNLSLKFIF
jgi:DNA invertase Pin-like site-specific DNA recombinase